MQQSKTFFAVASACILFFSGCCLRAIYFHSAIEAKLRVGMTYAAASDAARELHLRLTPCGSNQYYVDDSIFFGLAGADIDLSFDGNQRLTGAMGERALICDEVYYDIPLAGSE